MEVDFDSANSACFLQFSKIKFWTEESFCLAKNCAYNIRFLDDTFNFKFSVYNVLYRKGLGLSRKYATPICKFIIYLIMLIAFRRSLPANYEIMISTD